jgi:hypothetical protein
MKKLYKNWYCHNIIGHPVMGILQLLADVFRSNVLGRWALIIHDSTIPED